MTVGERSNLTGTVVDGRYRVGRRIGIGGTGVVFEAERLSDGHIVVIKTLRPCFLDHPDLSRRLRREAEVARNVIHPGIVPVIDEGTMEDGSPFIIMEKVRGESLSRILLRRNSLRADETALIAMRVASILHAAHLQGYTHRDVKPEHVLLDRDDRNQLIVHLLDFGVCTSPTAPLDEKAREEGRVFGTPSYVSPEQASGESNVDGRADLFSLGILMYECLSGRPPFRASNVANLLLRIIREDAPPLALCSEQIPYGITEVVHRALSRDVDGRFASARAMSRALVPFVADRAAVEMHLATQLHIDGEAAPNSPTVHAQKSVVTEAAA